jgi:hypothetical protein
VADVNAISAERPRIIPLRFIIAPRHLAPDAAFIPHRQLRTKQTVFRRTNAHKPQSWNAVNRERPDATSRGLPVTRNGPVQMNKTHATNWYGSTGRI